MNVLMLMPRNQKGFTLLEILLAVFIFAMISTGAYQLSTAAQKNAVAIRASQERLRDISLSFELLEKDLTQIVARTWRDPFGVTLNPPLQTDLASNYVLRMVRSGWRNPLGLNRSNQQIVTYRLKDDKLQRLYKLHLDSVSSVEPIETDLIDKVVQVELTFFDRQGNNNSSNSPQDQWPPISDAPPPVNTGNGELQPTIVYPLPIAVEITLELEDLGPISRIIPLAAGA